MKSKGYAARVRVGNLAITDGKQSRIPLYSGRRNSPYEWNIVGHDVDGKPTDPVMTIAAAKLDTFFPKGSPLDLVKIDVEGAAGSVFEGMTRLLREVRPMLLIEFHHQAEWEARTQLFERYALDLSGRRSSEARTQVSEPKQFISTTRLQRAIREQWNLLIAYQLNTDVAPSFNVPERF